MKLLTALGVVLAGLAAPGLAHAAPPIARPNPALVGIRLDYTDPLSTPRGTTATLPPLGRGAIAASMGDLAALGYHSAADLGGFRVTVPARGHYLFPVPPQASQLPLLETDAGGSLLVYGRATANPSPTPPDNGKGPVPGLGVVPPPPNPDGSVPSANQGFGGPPTNGGGASTGATTTSTTTTTRRRPPPPTTTTTTTTPATTTIATVTTSIGTTTSGGGGGGGGGGGTGQCGVPGLSITSSNASCTITIGTAAPGDSVTELMTVTNTSTTTYTLALQALGPNNNHLWQDLEMAVYQQGTPPPAPFPPLLYWLAQFNNLAVMNPGDSITYVVTLFLPTTAGNADQGKSATITFDWLATG